MTDLILSSWWPLFYIWVNACPKYYRKRMASGPGCTPELTVKCDFLYRSVPYCPHQQFQVHAWEFPWLPKSEVTCIGSICVCGTTAYWRLLHLPHLVSHPNFGLVAALGTSLYESEPISLLHCPSNAKGLTDNVYSHNPGVQQEENSHSLK